MISITTITREYRIFERDIDTWVDEGWFPKYEWHNGRRYWDSDVINAFVAGCPVNFAPTAASSIQRFFRRHFALNLVSSTIAFVATMITR